MCNYGRVELLVVLMDRGSNPEDTLLRIPINNRIITEVRDTFAIILALKYMLKLIIIIIILLFPLPISSCLHLWILNQEKWTGN